MPCTSPRPRRLLRHGLLLEMLALCSALGCADEDLQQRVPKADDEGGSITSSG